MPCDLKWRCELASVAAVAMLLILAINGCGRNSSPSGPTSEGARTAVANSGHVADWNSLVDQARREGATRIETDLPLGDDEVAQLAGMRLLKAVVLPQAAVSERAIEALATLDSLEELVLGNTTIGDSGLERLAGLPLLRDLNLNDSRVTDRGVEHLATLKRLELLRLGGSEITDDGLAAIGRIGSLRFLILQNAHITGRGFKHLHDLKQLESLYLQGNPLTGEGEAELRRALPELHPDW
jgi:hypothetical protein